MPAKLTPAAIAEQLAALNETAQPPWELADQHIIKTFRFADFAAAFRFMRQAAVAAEELDHHPDWRNRYNRVEVRLSTFSAGGLTELDFTLARRMEALHDD